MEEHWIISITVTTSWLCYCR